MPRGLRWQLWLLVSSLVSPAWGQGEEEWRTPAERAGYEATPSLEETLAFLERLAPRLPEMKLERFGTSAAGRPMTVAIVSKEKAFTPSAARAAGKPVVLVVNGIHAGEIDGKDACLELLRDLALGRRRELLDAGTLLVVPVYNVDGHERVSPYNRPNQDGPVRGMGFRTTVDGHDLNRDWLKIETPEARAMISLVREWDPHLAVDDHVTNGSDHDWTLTWSYPEAPQSPAPIADWIAKAIRSGAAADGAAGYRTGPYVDLLDGADPAKGFETAAYGPRFSTGYFALRNRATILVETHSHEPYADRVKANREFLAGLFAELARSGGGL
ncbi:MAG TPA: M14 family metallopeptidase, partial [Thermoanaerobaculia bacterium]|nr:M14 family metallopeptidase [Thermoanaerobaculia bacterium]